MCKDCGCSVTGVPVATADRYVEESTSLRRRARPLGPQNGAAMQSTTVAVLRSLLEENDRLAAHNREHFAAHGVLAINLMSAPGSGKTSLLERTIEAFAGQLAMAVIEGDLATENDARRIRAKGVPAVQITTGSACHLDARMVHEALHGLALAGLDVLFIENVGNLVCPASFDLGQHLDVALLSVPEGDDKPQKYPVMFRTADALVLSKCDLLPVLVEFDPQRAEASLRAVGSDAPVLRVSTRHEGGIGSWRDWLAGQLTEWRRRRGDRKTRGPIDERAAAIDNVGG